MSRLRTLLVAALSVSALLASVPAEAKQKHCPPGLAKKNRGDYAWIPREDWRRWNLRDYRDGSTYLRVDDQILRVVRDTLVVIEAVRIIDDALN
jgi:hypothetical protein